jgi:hypothetical protein
MPKKVLCLDCGAAPALVRVLMEEYGSGRLSRKHSTFYLKMMQELGLNTSEFYIFGGGETRHIFWGFKWLLMERWKPPTQQIVVFGEQGFWCRLSCLDRHCCCDFSCFGNSA